MEIEANSKYLPDSMTQMESIKHLRIHKSTLKERQNKFARENMTDLKDFKKGKEELLSQLVGGGQRKKKPINNNLFQTLQTQETPYN
jgi:predicted  nucleic acid-binding Zn-ribbon protein